MLHAENRDRGYGFIAFGAVFIFIIIFNLFNRSPGRKKLSRAQLTELVGVSRNTISSIETGQFNPSAKLALILCIALDKKFEELFYF